jgi:hypothetical protein
MVLMLTGYELDDYDEWKQRFDSDPGGRKAVAKGHRLSRSVDNPNEIYLAIEYSSADDARAVLSQLRDAGVFERFRPTFGPMITEVIEESTY